MPNLLNADLVRGFTVAQVAEKHGWPESMVWSLARPDTRPEIEPFTWEISSDQGLSWPVSAKEKPDLVIFDPPYFDKKAKECDDNSIFGLSRND